MEWVSHERGSVARPPQIQWVSIASLRRWTVTICHTLFANVTDQ
jgi:hypothetical protein